VAGCVENAGDSMTEKTDTRIGEPVAIPQERATAATAVADSLHSPLPWELTAANCQHTDTEEGYLIHGAGIESADGWTIADLNADIGADASCDAAKSLLNAEFIVRSCNSHYELLAALKALLENDAINLWVGGNPNVINAVVEQGLAAIAKAEGR
jgi:hypothetical protein